MAVKFPDRLESNNPSEYGIVKAVEVTGHKSVKNLQALYAIPDCILSDSKTNAEGDALGQLWYVISEEKVYQLIDWTNRRTEKGWKAGGKGIGGGFEGSIPVYSREEDIPEDTDDMPDEYLIAEGASPVFNEDEDKAMMMKAINALTSEVNRIKRTFTDHMDCGDILSNEKMITVGNDKSVEAIEPLWASDTGEPMPDPGTGVPEVKPEDTDLLKVAHLSIKSGKWGDFTTITKYLLPFEMVWIYDKNRLYIKQKSGVMYWINRDAGEDPNPPEPELPDMDNVEYIQFISPNQTKYRVTMTDEGEFKIINEREESAPDESGLVTSGTFNGLSKTLHLPKLYINSLYCGGIPTENSEKYQCCSHNFVELSNLTDKDISLKGLSLQYSINGTIWEVLPLEGIIKSGSTFLVRGAECSIMSTNTTIIKVKTYDMIWKDSSGNPIKFSNTKCKFLLTYGTKACDMADPYRQDTAAVEKAYCKLGYIDMVGLNKPGATSAEAIDGYEQTVFAQLVANNRMYHKYYAMDPVSQATKTIGKRKNSVDWTWIELTKTLQPDIPAYTPRASFENKTIFYNKTHLDESKPNMVTVTFGRDAHTTRCFNWVSVGYYDEFLWYRKSGATSWTKVESFKEGDNRSKYTSKFYNRIRTVATDGTAYTSHKYILSGLTAGTYEFQCGRDDEHKSEIQRFKAVAKSTTSSWSFIQTSDQQGFNWIEYEVWRKSAEYIRKNENPLFTVNTGDMTQNGNRINEWLDYYNAGKSLFQGQTIEGYPEFAGVEQMNIIGNNDLCPQNHEALGNGSDMSKINSVNFQFFYCYEMDEDNTCIINHNDIDYFIPSVYSFDYNDVHFIMVNSEIPIAAQDNLFGGADVYTFVKNWMEKDLAKTTSKWKIAVCHEMPFTIITADVINLFLKDPNTARGGSRLNTDIKSGDTYWFSKMLEKHGVSLCLGGHKHTYSVSHPLIDTVEDGKKLTMQPTIQTLDSSFESKLSEADKKICKVQVVSKITAPVYAMCQATGYKQTSNKELPAERIPWLANYFPSSVDVSGSRKPNAGQQYPFYIKWTISSDKIVGDVIKLDNIMTSGKFNINQQNEKPIAPLNGNGSSNSQIIINL